MAIGQISTEIHLVNFYFIVQIMKSQQNKIEGTYSMFEVRAWTTNITENLKIGEIPGSLNKRIIIVQYFIFNRLIDGIIL